MMFPIHLDPHSLEQLQQQQQLPQWQQPQHQQRPPLAQYLVTTLRGFRKTDR